MLCGFLLIRSWISSIIKTVIKMKKTTKEENIVQLNIRVSPELFSRFDAVSAENGLSNPKKLALLLDCYENRTHIPENAVPMCLPLFAASSYGPKTDTYSIRFYGQSIFEPDWTECTMHSSRCSELHNEIFKAHTWDFGNRRTRMRHKINLFFHCEEKRYLAQECIKVDEIKCIRDPECDCTYTTYTQILELSRCKFVYDFDDINRHFAKYASPKELEELSRILPNDIGMEYSLMDNLF